MCETKLLISMIYAVNDLKYKHFYAIYERLSADGLDTLLCSMKTSVDWLTCL
jgi:hypothetical protein